MFYTSSRPRMSGTALARPLMASLLGATMLLAPITAFADTMETTDAPSHYHHHMWGKTPEQRAETVEQRITGLHAKLQITPGEEADWSAVAQVMRTNETRMQDMISAREAEPVHHIDAPEDLRIYERFTQAHVEGLKALRASFETLYNAMPDDQKRVADDVFAKFGKDHH